MEELGALGETILYGHAEWIKTRNLMVLIHASELKLWHVSNACLYRDAIHLQCFPPTHYLIGCGHAHVRT